MAKSLQWVNLAEEFFGEISKPLTSKDLAFVTICYDDIYDRHDTKLRSHDLKEKVFLFQCKCCIETKFSRCSSQEFSGFAVLILFTILWILYVDITCKRVKPWRKGKSLNFSHLICDSYQAKINRSFLICEKFPSTLVFTCFFSRSLGWTSWKSRFNTALALEKKHLFVSEIDKTTSSKQTRSSYERNQNASNFPNAICTSVGWFD